MLEVKFFLSDGNASDVDLEQMRMKISLRQIVSVFFIADLFFLCNSKQMNNCACNMPPRLKNCKVSKQKTSLTSVLTSVTLSAENDALWKAFTAQPTGLPIIPWPEKGGARKGFNLHTAIELEDDQMLYCSVHVSSNIFTFIFLSNHT
jgi:hypothetical protein